MKDNDIGGRSQERDVFGTLWKKIKAWKHTNVCGRGFPGFDRGLCGIYFPLVEKYYPFLQVADTLKFGQLYRCQVCGSFWYLHEQKHWLNRIPELWLPLVHKWNQADLKINPTILDTLVEIGGVEDYFRESVFFPCAAQATSGNHYDKAIVIVTKVPPLAWPDLKLIHWANDLKGITPSPFALPIAVRRATRAKKEESLGFSPVGVLDDAGREYTIGCASDFFDFNSVKGQEIGYLIAVNDGGKSFGHNWHRLISISTGLINARSFFCQHVVDSNFDYLHI